MLCSCALSSVLGSPPQVRGKPIAAAIGPDAVGITPAGAGKTKRYQPSLTMTGDHPRRCGENLTLGQPSIVARGSPPQVRGKLLYGFHTCAHLGITPAGAGKTPVADARAVRAWDHPRRCGENPPPARHLRENDGSPPQVRGKHADTEEPPSADGITPAGAGKTDEHNTPNHSA